MQKTRILWFALCLALLSALLPFRSAAEAPEALRLPIVMYHHISRDPARWGTYVVSEAEFERDLQWLRAHCDPRVRVKASGGIASLSDARRFIELGADRLGTSRIVKIAMEQGYDPAPAAPAAPVAPAAPTESTAPAAPPPQY